jgi:hypothetical protein
MKTHLLFCITLLLTLGAGAQITTPVAKAFFGVDGELRTNYVAGFAQSSDDWFSNNAPGTGQLVIDTTGAAAIYSRYLVDPAFRKQPFFRTMRVPQYSIINNRLWIDAIYIRDYNGQSGGDETAYVLSNKNGDSPADWKGGVTSVLDKNDISDMLVHVKRAGPNKTDELWFVGGLSLQGTSGNRYFDFELYQTDIFYTRSTGQFTNAGPDAGHTAWQFDAAGNITKPGDVIFTAEYSSSSLTLLEARVWVDRAALSKPTTAFKWGGKFDGASTSSQYGYANILPMTTGDYYTGLQSGNGTWAGPFGFIDGGNNVQTNYTARQFMEFSVNLSKLGLDPITLLGTTNCGMPFRRILVKTRTSTSFSSELKDFIGPFDFFKAPAVNAVTNVPMFCGTAMNVSDITVTNPLQASVYTWSTPDGHFVDGTTGTTVRVDQPGTYIVKQQLLDGCSSYASDTVVIIHDVSCVPLSKSLLQFTGSLFKNDAQLQWRIASNSYLKGVTLQRSTDGKTFEDVYSTDAGTGSENYRYTDKIAALPAPQLYYRLVLQSPAGQITYSQVVRLQRGEAGSHAVLYPNPATSAVQVSFYNAAAGPVTVTVRNVSGAEVYAVKQTFSKGHALLTIDAVRNWAPGLYLVGITTGGTTEWLKCMVETKALNAQK